MHYTLSASHDTSNSTFERMRGEAAAVITSGQEVEHLADEDGEIINRNERSRPAA